MHADWLALTSRAPVHYFFHFLVSTMANNATLPCVVQPGETAWMLFSTVLVLGMMPGLAMFEAGLLRCVDKHNKETSKITNLLVTISAVLDCVSGSLESISRDTTSLLLALRFSFRGCVVALQVAHHSCRCALFSMFIHVHPRGISPSIFPRFFELILAQKQEHCIYLQPSHGGTVLQLGAVVHCGVQFCLWQGCRWR